MIGRPPAGGAVGRDPSGSFAECLRPRVPPTVGKQLARSGRPGRLTLAHPRGGRG